MIDHEPAKKLFWQYACNYFFLAHDGALEDYKRFGVSSEKEKEWRDEYIAHWISKLSSSDLVALTSLRQANAHESLQVLLKFSDYGDDYSKFWFAFTIAELAKLKDTDRKETIVARETAQKLWREILSKPNGISPEHRDEVKYFMLEGLKATTAEEYIQKFTLKKLKGG
jgi:hypothetical protein